MERDAGWMAHVDTNEPIQNLITSALNRQKPTTMRCPATRIIEPAQQIALPSYLRKVLGQMKGMEDPDSESDRKIAMRVLVCP